MDIQVSLNARPRAEQGTNASRQLRREEMVPAILYGPHRESRSLLVGYKEAKNTLFGSSGGQSLFKLVINDEGTTEDVVVTLKDYQLDPVRRNILHLDFMEVNLDQLFEVELPLVLVGIPKGVTAGGMLEQIRHSVLVSALPKNLPDNIEVDVSEMGLGDSLHVNDLVLPEGVRAAYDSNIALAIVQAPHAATAAEEEAAEEEQAE